MRIVDTSTIVRKSDLASLTTNESEWVYNGIDSAVTLEIFHRLMDEIDDVQMHTYNISRNLRAPVMEMSMRGIRIDAAARKRVTREFTRIITDLEYQYNRIITEGIGIPYLSWSSPTQVKKLFYEVLGLKEIRARNTAGKMTPTVNEEALLKLRYNYWAAPLCNLILAMREVKKKLEFLHTEIDSDGRIRSSFNITGTVTGRLSSSAWLTGTGRNMQNIDRSLRSIFIPDKGMKFINVDLEQGDSRNLAAWCWQVFYERGEAFAGSYLNACESSDLHTVVSHMVWPTLDWPTDTTDGKAMRAVAEQIFYRQNSYRQTSKGVGHGTNYLGTPYTIATQSKMPVSIINTFQSKYFSAFPCIPALHHWVRQQLVDYSFIQTIHGRGRHFFNRANYNDSDSQAMATWREAVAFGGQSATADAVNKAMHNIWLNGSKDIQLLCQVHDSLLFQVPEETVDERVPEILELGKAPLVLKGDRVFIVPNEAKVGYNWGDKDDEKNPSGLIKWSASKPDTRKNPHKAFTIRDY